jgi:outer membrane autotransporter protein
VTDNLAGVKFTAVTFGNQINLVASIEANLCGYSVSTAIAGPCAVAVNQTSISVSSGGSITNTGGDAITVLPGRISGFVANTGNLSASARGIYFGSGASLSGGLTNTGSIYGGNVGINLDTATLGGGLSNAHQVAGGVMGITLDSSVLSGGITNSGSIVGAIAGLALGNTTLSGGINNSGTIFASSTLSGTALKLLTSSITGGIANSGLLAARDYGVRLINGTISGAIDNRGSMYGGKAGLFIDPSTISSINNTVNITGGTDGIKISLSTVIGGITNSGLISGGNRGIYLTQSIVNGGINNANSIGGGSVGVKLSLSTVTGGLTNSGKISGGVNTGNAGILIDAASAIDSIRNTGVISGAYSIWNQGSISSLTNAQGGGTNAALTYKGILPSTYFVLISSASNYGQVNFSSITGTMTFGGVASGSALFGGHTYTGIFSGISASGLGLAGNTTQVGTYSGTKWTLFQEVANPNTWDLAVQNNAASQTPVLTGAGSQATAVAQRGLGQAVQGRQNILAGVASGDGYIAGKDFWMKGYGSWANQNDVNNVAGYKINTGGIAFGLERDLSPRAMVGGVMAISNSYANSNSSTEPSSLSMSTYQIGAYGHYNIDKTLRWTYQANLGLSNQKESRNLSKLLNTSYTASANYNAYTQYVGTGIQDRLEINDKTRIIPSLNLDYAGVQSKGYTETGAGAYNLSVNSQNYNELYSTAGLRVERDITPGVKVSANVGAGYNWLNSQIQATAASQGGGGSFVTNGLSLSPWLYNAGVGVTGSIYKNVEISVRYDYQTSPSGYSNQIVGGKVKINF